MITEIRSPDRVGPRRIMAAGLALQALGLGWFALQATDVVSYAALVLPLIVTAVFTAHGHLGSAAGYDAGFRPALAAAAALSLAGAAAALLVPSRPRMREAVPAVAAPASVTG